MSDFDYCKYCNAKVSNTEVECSKCGAPVHVFSGNNFLVDTRGGRGEYLQEVGKYKKIENWYDNIIALAVVGGNFSTYKNNKFFLETRAIPVFGTPFVPPQIDLLVISDNEKIIFVLENGMCQTMSKGICNLRISIKNKPEISTTISVNVSGERYL